LVVEIDFVWMLKSGAVGTEHRSSIASRSSTCYPP
jgi:hypothetical protein